MVCSVKNIPIFYEEYGEGKPVLCIHGYSVDHRLMTGCLEPVFSPLPGYRRIYPDLPGMGKTPSAPWIKNADDMLKMLEGFIQAVIPDENFLLVGESYGGYLSLGLLREMQSKIEGVMLICPVIFPKGSDKDLPPRCVLWTSDDLSKMAAYPGVDGYLDMAVIATPENYQKYRRDVSPGIEAADSDFLSQYACEGYGFTFENDIRNLAYDKPTSILAGRQDHVVGYSQALEILTRFPRATYAVLDCAGHSLQIENEPLFTQHMKDWLWRVDLAQRSI